jgi:hypothetical protein
MEMPNKVNVASGSRRSAAKGKMVSKAAKGKMVSKATKKPKPLRALSEFEDYRTGARSTVWKPQVKKGYRISNTTFDNTGMTKDVLGPKTKGKSYESRKKKNSGTTASIVRRADKANPVYGK